MTETLQVDLSDVKDVRAKLPAAEAILRQKEAVFNEAQGAFDEARRGYEFWRGHVEYLTTVAALDTTSENGVMLEPAPATAVSSASAAVETSTVSPSELVVALINREGRAIRSQDVQAVLASEGHVFDKNTVSNALYYAASERGGSRIAQVRRGMYAPLGASIPRPPSGAEFPAGFAATTGGLIGGASGR